MIEYLINISNKQKNDEEVENKAKNIEEYKKICLKNFLKPLENEISNLEYPKLLNNIQFDNRSSSADGDIYNIHQKKIEIQKDKLYDNNLKQQNKDKYTCNKNDQLKTGKQNQYELNKTKIKELQEMHKKTFRVGLSYQSKNIKKSQKMKLKKNNQRNTSLANFQKEINFLKECLYQIIQRYLKNYLCNEFQNKINLQQIKMPYVYKVFQGTYKLNQGKIFQSFTNNL
ncbi:hypothetical protein PPERSA_03542 [Pseudocohnilembus persalinus]|uniref:Uncharacterized protein n=1 Tax=Pseudocohnilembus persalinus TaxID=266149 RepID=A0A0V0Q816_PSEPJ|nr:hypothetical protein PPERSA_03542 [Pseudocohnilembus persalinus]|eukprot:KRW98370.1 hypothetical protein PPERSA_03542 [Pseudocohnilembus persalinus]